MRIIDINVHRVNLPLETAYHWAPGRYYGASKGIVEVCTDEDIVGLGEIPTVELADTLEREQVPRLIGADPLNIEACRRRCVPEASTLTNTHDLSLLKSFGGLEIALWDIKGKALGVPISSLLGGPARSEVAFSEYFAFRDANGPVAGEATPVEVAAYCARMREEHGSTVFEGKVAVRDLEADLAMVKEVRAAIGSDAVLRLDANKGWPLNTARKALRGLEPYDIANIEDPVAGFHEMAKLRQHSAIPFSSHLPDIRLAAALGVPDTFVLNLSQLGGIRQTLKFIDACECFAIGFWFYSGDSGIGTAAYLQVSAAVAYLEQPHQSLLRWYVDDVIAEGPFKPKKGVLSVPPGPGLGVSLDRESLSRCKKRFERDGIMQQLGIAGEAFFTELRRQ